MQDTGTANRVLGAASAGTIGEVQIATDMIADDAVTTDKLDNSINSAITANTAKTTNATHSGEVTGSGALTIADDVVDEANLKVSNSPTNGYMLTAQSGNTGGLTWAEAGGGGLEGADSWRLNQNVAFGSGTRLLDGGWERVDTDGYGVIGSAISQSSGVFSFPATGIWLINFSFSAYRPSNSLQYTQYQLQTTTNDGTYNAASIALISTSTSNTGRNSGSNNFIFDVTNTSNCKFRFVSVEAQGNASDLTTLGATDVTWSGFAALKIGST
jgi:hypothetical protein